MKVGNNQTESVHFVHWRIPDVRDGWLLYTGVAAVPCVPLVPAEHWARGRIKENRAIKFDEGEAVRKQSTGSDRLSRMTSPGVVPEEIQRK